MPLPISVVIPTRNRPKILLKTLNTFRDQTTSVSEVVIIDGSEGNETRDELASHELAKSGIIIYIKASQLGAASQRNQGVVQARYPFILFADDDVYLEPDCVAKLWEAMESGISVGGVSAMITNQKYLPLGRITSAVVRFLFGKKMTSYAGKLIPPGWGMLPEDRDDMPVSVEMEWLNLGATLYRKEALPIPPFQSHFKGYSMMEDITLSASVSKKWKLLNARTARIYHDSQPGDHKKNAFLLSRMELKNRYYLMTQVLNRRKSSDYLRLFIFECFGMASSLQSFAALKQLPSIIAGKVAATFDIIVSP
jgi:glycosyltransferase involved in cell wall biosynthesis